MLCVWLSTHLRNNTSQLPENAIPTWPVIELEVNYLTENEVCISYWITLVSTPCPSSGSSLHFSWILTVHFYWWSFSLRIAILHCMHRLPVFNSISFNLRATPHSKALTTVQLLSLMENKTLWKSLRLQILSHQAFKVNKQAFFSFFKL